MYTSNYTIQSQILDSWEAFKDAGEDFIEDNLTVMADSAVPVYYSDILKDWAEMPSEFNDSWEEFGVPQEITIFGLMTVDLYSYYQDAYRRIYQEILAEELRLAEEAEEAEEEETN